jgi:tetratricopeptide (TPR) repeat protein
MKKYKFLAIVSLLLLTLFSGCSEDFLETKSTQSIDEALVFTDTKNAMLAVNGLHKLMWSNSLSTTAPRGGFEMLMVWMDMLGEDLVYTYANAQYQSEAKWVTHRNYTGSGHLLHFFSLLNYFTSNANMIMDNIDNATGPDNEKNNIKGQALFYRAFGYFYLVQLWGERYKAEGNNTQLGVVLRNDHSVGPKARSSVEEVYKLINDDLDEAIDYLKATTVQRPNKTHIDLHLARGLKARVLLAQGKWTEAAEMAKLVVEQSGAKLQADTYTTTNNRFSDQTNTEWLWGAKKVEDQMASLRSFHEYMSNQNASYNGNTPRAIFNLLYNRITETDVRKGIWFPNAADKSWLPRPAYSIGGSGRVANYMANKYLITNTANKANDVPFMRLPEMMLIMAEGYARAGRDAEAQNALYPLANHRDPLYVKSTKTGADLIDEVMFQRRVELWGEGFRFTDLKRLNMPLDRGPAPRDGYNKNWWPIITGAGTDTFVLTNWDPEASNFNMYGDGTVILEANRYREAGHKEWQFLFHQSVTDTNPLCEQNPL